MLTGLGRCFVAVDEAVAARPHGVVRAWQIRHDEPSAIVGDDALDVANGQVVRLRNHPHAGFGSIWSRDDAADVVRIDGDIVPRLLGAGRGEDD